MIFELNSFNYDSARLELDKFFKFCSNSSSSNYLLFELELEACLVINFFYVTTSRARVAILLFELELEARLVIDIFM